MLRHRRRHQRETRCPGFTNSGDSARSSIIPAFVIAGGCDTANTLARSPTDIRERVSAKRAFEAALRFDQKDIVVDDLCHRFIDEWAPFDAITIPRVF